MNYITFRKKYLLPFKWNKKKNKKAKQMSTRSNREIIDKVDAVTEQLRAFERNNWEKEVRHSEGQLDILNWLINTKDNG